MREDLPTVLSSAEKSCVCETIGSGMDEVADALKKARDRSAPSNSRVDRLLMWCRTLIM